MTDKTALTETERLVAIARRFRELQAEHPDLWAEKLINRMHAEGGYGVVTIADIEAGEKLITSDLSGMTAKAIGEMVGMSSREMKALLLDPPEGFPSVTQAAKRGVVDYFVVDIDLLKAWVAANED